jgi:high affinity Mn2+ porin
MKRAVGSPDFGSADHMLSNRIVLGAVADATFPSFQNLAGVSIGDTSNLNSPINGPESYSETMLSSGTARARIGYAPGNWLFYGTGGFAWTYDQLTLTRRVTGTTDTPVAFWLGGWGRRRGPVRAALDGKSRIPVDQLPA